jgi:phosphopantetheinyl transferase
VADDGATTTHVWLAGPLPVSPDARPGGEATSAFERRVRSIAEDRDRARTVLAVAISDLMARPVSRVRVDRDGHGRPYLPGYPAIDVTLSRAAGAVGVGVSRGGRIGVDLERLRPVPRRAERFGRAFSRQEWSTISVAAAPDAELLQIWTRKEALLKAIGVGLTVCPREVLGGSELGSDGLELRVRPTVDPLQRRWSIWTFHALAGYVASCAVSTNPTARAASSPHLRLLEGASPQLRYPLHGVLAPEGGRGP